MIRNLRIVKEVLETEFPNYRFSIFNLLKFSRKENLKKYYIGNRFKYFHKPIVIEDDSGNELSGIYSKNVTTLLKHEQGDDYYYDLLDDNIKCQLRSENLEYGSNICSNVISLEDKVKKIRWKEGM